MAWRSAAWHGVALRGAAWHGVALPFMDRPQVLPTNSTRPMPVALERVLQPCIVEHDFRQLWAVPQLVDCDPSVVCEFNVTCRGAALCSLQSSSRNACLLSIPPPTQPGRAQHLRCPRSPLRHEVEHGRHARLGRLLGQHTAPDRTARRCAAGLRLYLRQKTHYASSPRPASRRAQRWTRTPSACRPAAGAPRGSRGARSVGARGSGRCTSGRPP